MKKFLGAIFVLISSLCHAQQPAPKESDAIEAVKIAFISKQMGLTPEEAQKFWPVYNQYMDEFKKLKQDNNTDILDFREKSLNLLKKYRPDFIKSVGQDKFNKLLKSEGDWRQFVKDEINRRRQLRQQIKRNRQ